MGSLVEHGLQAPERVGLSLRWLLLLWSMDSGLRSARASYCVASLVVEHGLRAPERAGSVSSALSLSSCGAQAWLLCSMWGLTGPRDQVHTPELAGELLTTEPPGSP